MAQGRGRLRLRPEAAEERLVVGQAGMQHLDRHPAPQAHVIGQVHLRRRPRAEWREESVSPAQHTTDLLGHAGHGHDARILLPRRWTRSRWCCDRARPLRLRLPGPGVPGLPVAMATRTSPYSTRFKIVAAVVVALAGVLFYLAFTSLGDDDEDRCCPRATAGGREPHPPPQRPGAPAVERRHRPGRRVVGPARRQRHRDPDDELVITPQLGLIEFTPGDAGGRGARQRAELRDRGRSGACRTAGA